MPLDAQTRLNITRWNQDYIAGLIENHNGKSEDVRTTIHDIHDSTTNQPSPTTTAACSAAVHLSQGTRRRFRADRPPL